MKAFVMKVDTAQSITHGIGDHRRAAGTENLSDQTSQTAEQIVVNYFPWIEGTYREPSITKWRNAE